MSIHGSSLVNHFSQAVRTVTFEVFSDVVEEKLEEWIQVRTL